MGLTPVIQVLEIALFVPREPGEIGRARPRRKVRHREDL